MALFLNKNCTSRGVNSFRNNILRIEIFRAQKLVGVSHENRVTRIRCQNVFFKQKFQNIILPVTNSGVIRKVTLKSDIILGS